MMEDMRTLDTPTTRTGSNRRTWACFAVLPLILMLATASCSLRGRSSMDADTSALPVVATPPPPLVLEEAPAAEAPARQAKAPSYRIAPGDLLSIHFPDLGDLNFQARVRPDGYVTTPRYGDTAAMGLTPAMLGDTLAALYAVDYLNPVSHVQVLEFGPEYFYVFGEVGKPDRYLLDGPLDLVSAVTRAGGFLHSANTGQVVIVKVAADGRYGFEIHDLDDLVGRDGATPVWIEASDIVIVPETAIANMARFTRDYIMTFMAPMDAFLRGRYYWVLADDTLNR